MNFPKKVVIKEMALSHMHTIFHHQLWVRVHFVSRKTLITKIDDVIKFNLHEILIKGSPYV